MTPHAGQPAPDFDAVSDDGRRVRLADLRGRWVVLFFYPKASSPGCSLEARRFEGALPEFERHGALVVGVSTDTEAAQARFRDGCGLSFPLLPDGDKVIGRAYGVIGGVTGLLGFAARQTFLIDPQGVVARHWRQVNPVSHAADVLGELQARSKAVELGVPGS